MGKHVGMSTQGLEGMLKRLEALGGNSQDAIASAMEQAKDVVTKQIEKATSTSRFNFSRTGTTLKSLDKTSRTYWNGTKGIIDVGFDIDNGGLPSIFLMYGTPKISPDRNLYNSIYGKKVKEMVIEAEEDAIFELLRKERLK